MGVKEKMTKRTLCFFKDEKISDAYIKMTELKIRHIPVIDKFSKEILGIVSDRDILLRSRVTASGMTQENVTMGTIMTTDLLVVDDSCKISEAAELMLQKKIDCLPIIDRESNILKGIITSTDLLDLLVKDGAGKAEFPYEFELKIK
jgi:CBS domain-containing protein